MKWGKNSVGWHFGFKLHLIINDCGELLAFSLTPANVDARKPVPDMTRDLIGNASCFSQGKTLRVACLSAGVQVGTAAQRTGSPFFSTRLNLSALSFTLRSLSNFWVN